MAVKPNATPGAFFSYTGRAPVPSTASQGFTPWQASIDREAPPPAVDLSQLAFGSSNFTNSTAYQAANLPPYNSQFPWSEGAGSSSTTTTTILEIAGGAALLGIVAYFLFRR